MGGKKYAAALAAVINLALLGACKYLGFFGSGLALLGVELSLPEILAPAGVSFFTFKGISYVCDAARRPKEGTRSFFEALFYISFLPEVMSPLSRFSAFRAQLARRERSWERTAWGARRFILGLGKKLLLSGAAAVIADAAFTAGDALTAPLAWLGAAAYSLQLYLDFSGYSDMAVGLGAMLGFACPENFNYPYAATSITDFWRRWHISLSLWFRDYLYIPLGGSRRGKWRTAANKAAVFVLCGLWHGANMTFVLWGAWHALLSALESLKALDVERWRKTAAGRALSRVYALLAVSLGFVMFRAPDVGSGFAYLGAMFTRWELPAAARLLLARSADGYTLALLALGALISLPVLPALRRRLSSPEGALRPAADAAGYALSLALLVLCASAIASGGFAPFIYFQF